MIVLITLFQILIFSERKHRSARQTLLFDDSFDLPNSAKTDNLIGLKMVFRTIKWICSPKVKPQIFNGWGKVLALDGVQNAHLSNSAFCSMNQIELFHNGLSYRGLFENATVVSKIKAVLLCVILGIVVFPFTLFFNNRANIALIIRYYIQIDFIASIVNRHGIKKIYDFAAYSNASNWSTLVFQKLGVHVLKIPSIVPLAAHLNNMVANEVAISTPYHQDEFDFFDLKATVNSVVHTLPKHSDYLIKYRNQRPKSKRNVIGYYSHASWLRASHDHGESQFGLPALEQTLLKHLSKIIDSLDDVELFVFTHPRERHVEVLENTRNYYQTILGSNNRFELYTGTEKSSLIFEHAGLGVGTMSSVLLERLLCGYKTLFYTEGMQGFPVPKSSISSICADNYSNLKLLVEGGIQLNEDDFFSKMKLENYILDSNFYP